ncbi:hypothetical protein BA011_18540 [Rhizobium leguminosarum]|uniref:Integrase n=1 Tax=Rhizobium leguminosarum TaxID=384 RepID=A0A1B1CCP1_RHILE|nr:hypothetical protein BA011_18540 [Rhizobium leguminosarum]
MHCHEEWDQVANATGGGFRAEADICSLLKDAAAAMIYKATGNLRAIRILLGHTKIENTVRYLGVDIEDALELAEHAEI